MNFLETEIQSDIRDMARKFGQKEIAPIVDADEAASRFRPELFQKAGAAGLLGITSPEKYGGSELGYLEYAIVLEELAYYSSGYATSLSVTGLPMRVIEALGSEYLKDTYVADLVSGEKIGCFCLTEAGSGSDAGALNTTAVNEGDHYILNGVKQFITNGAYADTMLVMARTGRDGAGGISSFIVEKAFEGVKASKSEVKMGMRVSPTQEMTFTNVRVPAKNLVGEEGKGFRAALGVLDGGRISIAAIAVGLARAALDKAAAYAKEREQFGKPIKEFQGIGFMLADMATELEASRLMVYQAANLKDAGKPFTREASMAKLKATEACMQITTDAVQVLGGYGYIEEFQVERFMREAKMLQLVEGTSQIQRIVISRNL